MQGDEYGLLNSRTASPMSPISKDVNNPRFQEEMQLLVKNKMQKNTKNSLGIGEKYAR